MSCDCISRIESGLEERGYRKAEILSKAWFFDGKGTQITGQFEHEVDTKTGKTKKKKENLYFAHCPICGKAYDDEEARHEE